MTIQSVAGTKFKISATAPTAFTAAGYAALTYLTIGEVTAGLDSIGYEYAVIEHKPIDTRAVQIFKGSYSLKGGTLTVALDTDDAGQNLAKVAEKSDSDYYFDVEAQNGDHYYFPAKVMSFTRGFGGVDDIVSASIEIRPTVSKAGIGLIEVLAP